MKREYYQMRTFVSLVQCKITASAIDDWNIRQVSQSDKASNWLFWMIVGEQTCNFTGRLCTLHIIVHDNAVGQLRFRCIRKFIAKNYGLIYNVCLCAMFR